MAHVYVRVHFVKKLKFVAVIINGSYFITSFLARSVSSHAYLLKYSRAVFLVKP